MSLYDVIGRGYDTTRRADPYITGRILAHLDPVPEGKYLDIACGTGNYTIALRQSGLSICGIDRSEIMIGAARQKSPDIEWHRGSAEALPFPDGEFMGVTCVLAIHHFSNLLKVFDEAARVIKSGKLVIFTADPAQMESYWINRYFPEAIRRSIAQMPSREVIIDAFRKAGFVKIDFETYEIREDLSDFFLYSGKNHPEIYLDPKVRAGISTFADLAGSEEANRGCRLLEEDIHSGKINRIIESFSSGDKGDYSFIIGHKILRSSSR